MTDNYDALRNAASPEQFCASLEAIACNLHEDAAECEHFHQDRNAGKPWHVLAQSLEVVANTFALTVVRAPRHGRGA